MHELLESLEELIENDDASENDWEVDYSVSWINPLCLPFDTAEPMCRALRVEC